MLPMGRGCATSLSLIRVGGGAKPTMSLPGRSGNQYQAHAAFVARSLPSAAPAAAAQRRRLGDGPAARLRAEHPGHVWALDFQFDETAVRRRLKLLNVIDEFTREALAIHVDHSINADKVVEVVEAIAAVTGAPGHLRMDNGPELVADALRDWCQHSGTETAYTEPGRCFC